MKNLQKNLQLLFSNYGTIEILEEDEKIILYKFSCDTSKLFEKNSILSCLGILNFALLVKSGTTECFIYCFRIGEDKASGNDILELINHINSSLEYGKYILDSEGDINWEYKFDIEHISKEDIYDILKVFITSLLTFSVHKNELIRKRKQKEINE
ncbi:MAG: YbjN domain-containing protein [Lachnospiraceae bacterium]|nr:YbjN domain-containing protein [Lachnospiraceae bacterium]